MKARSTKVTRVVLVFGVLAIFLNGCEGTTRSRSRANDSDAVRQLVDRSTPFPDVHHDRPFVFLWVSPAYSENAIHGIAAAIWDDGKIVRAASEKQIGKSYVRGKLTADQLANARRATSTATTRWTWPP